MSFVVLNIDPHLFKLRTSKHSFTTSFGTSLKHYVNAAPNLHVKLVGWRKTIDCYLAKVEP